MFVLKVCRGHWLTAACSERRMNMLAPPVQSFQEGGYFKEGYRHFGPTSNFSHPSITYRSFLAMYDTSKPKSSSLKYPPLEPAWKFSLTNKTTNEVKSD